MKKNRMRLATYIFAELGRTTKNDTKPYHLTQPVNDVLKTNRWDYELEVKVGIDRHQRGLMAKVRKRSRTS